LTTLIFAAASALACAFARSKGLAAQVHVLPVNTAPFNLDHAHPQLSRGFFSKRSASHVE